MAGKREAKQRAGQSGRKEKNRGEAEESARAKEPLEDAGRKSAQETQKKEAHKDLKDQGETKNSSVTKRRQVRKVATMVKRLKKSPEDGELQTPTGRGGGVPGRRWLGRAAASHSDSVRPVSRNAAQRGVAGPCQLDGEDPAQRKRK